MLHAKQKLQNQKNRDELRDTYVKDQIRRVFSIPTKTIYEYPDLIENYRQQIKVKRLLKTKKDESNETS